MEFRAAVVQRLRGAIDFEWFVWVLTDPVTEVGADPFAIAPDLGQLPTLVRLKYLTRLNRWTTLHTVGSLGSDPHRSPVWMGIQRQHGVADVLSTVFRDGYGCWGFLDLWLTEPATPSALDLVAELTPLLTQAVRTRLAATFATPAGPQDAPAGAAVILLDDNLQITGSTPGSQSWLARLLPPVGRPDPVPAAALNVAAQLLAQEAGVDDHAANARTHLSHGLWITLKAARLRPSGVIAVTIEPSTAAERLDVFARSHALTARERQLLTVLAEGADTRQVAAQLFLSEHTVQDHLKSIFGKTATNSRRALLANAVGVRTNDT